MGSVLPFLLNPSSRFVPLIVRKPLRIPLWTYSRVKESSSSVTYFSSSLISIPSSNDSPISESLPTSLNWEVFKASKTLWANVDYKKVVSLLGPSRLGLDEVKRRTSFRFRGCPCSSIMIPLPFDMVGIGKRIHLGKGSR